MASALISARWRIETVSTVGFRHKKWKWSNVVKQEKYPQQTFSTGLSISLHLPHLHQFGMSSPGGLSGPGSSNIDFNKLNPPCVPARRKTALWSWCTGSSCTYSCDYIYNMHVAVYQCRISSFIIIICTSSCLTSASWEAAEHWRWVLEVTISCIKKNNSYLTISIQHTSPKELLLWLNE